MSRNWRRLCATAVVTALSIIPIAWGLSSGALSGFTSGPAGGGEFCHACHVPYNHGTGSVEVLGAPTRYRAGQQYDLTVRITAPDEDGAGFQLSAEGTVDHIGALILTDPINTAYSQEPATGDYVTHTRDGLDNSRAAWPGGGGSYDYHVRWRAPTFDAGDVTFHTSVITVNSFGIYGGSYYRTYEKSLYAVPGDVDGDGDVDLRDHAMRADCFTGPGVSRGPACEFADFDGDGDVDLVDVASSLTAATTATSPDPPGYVLADGVRGGLLYDKWWPVNGAAEPQGDHPLYPAIGQKSGSTTFRCKECHGWDYKGAGGAYASGSHFTGITGVLSTTLTPQDVFDLLAGSDTKSGGHDLPAYGMTDRELWDVVKFVLEGVVDTDLYIDGSGAFIGSALAGEAVYGTDVNEGACATCHGVDGQWIDIYGSGIYIGTVANDNPWEFLHKTRYGHPGSPMTSFELLNWPLTMAADVGAHSATLPQ